MALLALGCVLTVARRVSWAADEQGAATQALKEKTEQTGKAEKEVAKEPVWKSLFDGKTLKNWKSSNFGGEGKVGVDRIKGLPGVVNVDQVEGRPDYRVSYDWTETDTNTLLRGLLELGAPIVGFTEDKRHLNDAFMDLTTKGVK